MTCGGGMGGSVWNEYVTTNCQIQPNQMITVKDAITGEEKIINTNFIVKVETVYFVTLTWNTTAHANYDRYTVKKRIQTEHYQIPITDKYEVCYGYGGKNEKYFVTNEIVDEH